MTERDKWSRIPVTVYELSQDFCAWRWDNLPCGAGDNSNYVIYSREFGVNSIWTFVGSPTTSTAGWIDLDDRNGFNYYVQMAPLDAVGIDFADLPLFPTFTVIDQEFYGSFYYQETAGGVDQLLINVNFYYVNVGGSGVIQKDIYIDPTANTVVSSDTIFSEINITPGAGGTPVNPWTRVTYKFNPQSVIPAGAAYTLSSAFAASPTGSGVIRVIAPQISKGEISDYRQTDGEPVEAQAAPCFNTLSSCQSLENYAVKGLSDACLLAFNSTTGWEYLSNFEGARDEGLFLEFYLGQRAAQSISITSTPLIDVDGLLTVSIAYNHGVDPAPILTFSAPGGSISYTLTTNGARTYRLAAYISRGGTLQVRGVSGSVSCDSFDTAPQSVFVGGTLTMSSNFAIADLLLYDYEAKQISGNPVLQNLEQKGDLYGDVLLHVPFKRVQKATSSAGIVPQPQQLAEFAGISGDTPRNDEFFVVDSDGQVTLEQFNGTTATRQLLEPPLILRFTEKNKSSKLPEELRAIPSLIRVSNRPSQLSVGGTNENIGALGSRDSSAAQFIDHPYSDYLVDPYVTQRDYTPEEQGTFWGKWLARNQYREGFKIKHVSGYELESGGLERLHEYNYTLDKVSGPDGRGNVQIQAYDILQSVRSDRAVYPAANTGRLSADITAVATAFDVQPAGIGDIEYPASGRVRIGGEGFNFTRSGDTFTVTGRGLYGGADEHEEDDLIQLVAVFSSQSIHDIAYDIITNALPELATNIDKVKWDSLAADFLPRLYSADITEPTGVEELLGELTATAPIYFYTDIRTNSIELGVIREPASVAIELDEDQEIIADSVKLQEYPKERIDEVWVYYRIRNAAEGVADPENYSQRFILVNADEQVKRGRRAIKRIYTRWIVAGARDVAEEIAQAVISRFQNPPVRVAFDVDAKKGDIWLGDVTKLLTRQKQTITGEKESDLNYQIISADEKEDGHKFSYLAQSYEFFAPFGYAGGGGGSLNEIKITIIDENTLLDFGGPGTDNQVNQLNLYELYRFATGAEFATINFVVAGGPLPDGGAVVGAREGQNVSLHLPDATYWTWTPTINLRIEPGAVVAGRGGAGGSAGETTAPYSLNGKPGENGKTGFLVEYPVTVNNLGIIGGGGGGGGGGGNLGFQGSILYPGGGGGGGAGRKGGAGGLSLFRFIEFGQVSNNPPLTDNTGSTGGFIAGGNGGQYFDTVNTTVGGRTSIFGIYFKTGRGGRGGDLGQAGQAGTAGLWEFSPVFYAAGGDSSSATTGTGGGGGQPGLAIDGESFITYTNGNKGDIRGNTA